MSLKQRCNYDGCCAGYPHSCKDCAIVKYVKEEVRVVKATNNVTVSVGGKAYRAIDADFTQTADEYPMIDVRAVLSPINKIQAPNLSIKEVIFSPPATIVFWSDNTKTVVKADYAYDSYDPEKGIAMAISKKLIGDNKYEYYHVFKHWLKKWEKQNAAIDDYFVPGEY